VESEATEGGEGRVVKSNGNIFSGKTFNVFTRRWCKGEVLRVGRSMKRALRGKKARGGGCGLATDASIGSPPRERKKKSRGGGRLGGGGVQIRNHGEKDDHKKKRQAEPFKMGGRETKI